MLEHVHHTTPLQSAIKYGSVSIFSHPAVTANIKPAEKIRHHTKMSFR